MSITESIIDNFGMIILFLFLLIQGIILVINNKSYSDFETKYIKYIIINYLNSNKINSEIYVDLVSPISTVVNSKLTHIYNKLTISDSNKEKIDSKIVNFIIKDSGYDSNSDPEGKLVKKYSKEMIPDELQLNLPSYANQYYYTGIFFIIFAILTPITKIILYGTGMLKM
jgi:hypothetical protein